MIEDFSTSGEVIKNIFKGIECVLTEGDSIRLPTGFRALDDLTGGLYPCGLTIIAGRPGIGKTAFCMNIAASVALKEKMPVAIFSQGMSNEDLMLIMLGQNAGLNPRKIKDGRMHESDWAKLTVAAGRFSEAPIYIDDSLNTVTEIRKKAAGLNSRLKNGLKLVVIDCLQLMTLPDDSEEINNTLNGLGTLGNVLKVPVVATIQSRETAENRENKRPTIQDLPSSAAIERYAEEIFFLHRDEVYNQAEDNPRKGIAEIIFAKHRNGIAGTVELRFCKEVQRFEDVNQVSYKQGCKEE